MTIPMPQLPKTCFVVMGFGEKTDFQTQRLLDLDKTYHYVIKRAVEDAGLQCIRADDIVHAGVIDKPMYDLLLSADAVIADLSTSNANAIYELGVRHALRPHTTIVIAEKQFKFPFDLHSLLIRKYEHLGKGIDIAEAERMRAELATALKTLISAPAFDSPVYTFLPSLNPPALEVPPSTAAKNLIAAAAVGDALANTSLLASARAARAEGKFVVAQSLLTALRERQPADPYVIQQLALVTYKAGQPTPEASLLKAHELLSTLNPQASSDPETLGLWGAVHKRLWELNSKRSDLDEAIWAYERGFYLRNDSYTGINYAFLLNVRAGLSSRSDAITDFTLARRHRHRVIEVCEQALQSGIKDDEGNPDPTETFWRTATLIEAYVGIGDEARAAALTTESEKLHPEPWMRDTLAAQLKNLRLLLGQQVPLIAALR